MVYKHIEKRILHLLSNLYFAKSMKSLIVRNVFRCTITHGEDKDKKKQGEEDMHKFKKMT